MARKKFQKRGRRVKYSASKKLVTGHGPTLLDRIASGVGSVAKLATAVAPAIAAINTESKYYDQTATVQSYTPGTNDQIISLTDAIAAGVADNQRVGNSFLAKSLQIRLAHNFTPAVGPPAIHGLHCRMMLVCWKDNASQNIISASKLFEAPTNLYSPVNKDYSDSFVVMKDKYFTLNAQINSAYPQAFSAMKIYKDINWHMRFSSSAASSGTTNHIFLVLRSSATGSTNGLSTTYYSRLIFTDN